MKDPRDRIIERISISDDGCWIWPRLGRDGYPRITVAHRFHCAHRFSFEAFIGPIPPGWEIDHLCCTPSCVNPGHLEAVTPEENQRRAAVSKQQRSASRTHCKNGHELPVVRQRQCPTCKALWMAANRHRYPRG